MPDFRPYTIHHLPWDAIGERVLPPGCHYLVLWKGGVPLGHYWMNGRPAAIALTDNLEELSRVVRPVLDHYEQQAPTPEMAVLPSLSVIICTRNRPLDLERSIKALMGSADSDFELMVVDNAPEDDRTARIVARYPAVRYLHEPRPGLDIARNTGAKSATGEIVAYTDDDAEVAREWTREVKSAFADPLVMAVTGLVIPSELDTLSQYVFEKYWSFNKGYLPRIFDHGWFRARLPYGVPAWEIGAGANMAFRRDVFLLAGWFDERLDVGAAGCSGDSEMWYRVLAEGWKCLYLPQLVVYHHHRREMKDLRRQIFFYMRGHVCAGLVQYEKYGYKGERKRIYRVLPLYYLKKWVREIFRRDPVIRASGSMIWDEVRGCLSGWRYYRAVRQLSGGRVGRRCNRHDPEPLTGGDPLKAQAVVREETKVSVIIPSYNHGQYLGQAIQSVLDQSYPNREIIVVDDGSTDSTDQVCGRYAGVRYIRVDRVGPSVARNIGVRLCSGEFVTFLDADDILYPNALELNLYYFGYYPDAVFISGGFDRIAGDGRLLEAPEPIVRAGNNYNALLQGNYIGMEATVLYRRELFFRYSFDSGVVACEDYDLNLRIARDLPVYGHAHKIAAYRIHGQNRSKNRAWMARMAVETLKKQEKYIRNEEERDCFNEGIKNWLNFYKVKTL